jgi:hypothetical protein
LLSGVLFVIVGTNIRIIFDLRKLLLQIIDKKGRSPNYR